MFRAFSILAALGPLGQAAALPTLPLLEVGQSATSFNASLGNVTIFATGMPLFGLHLPGPASLTCYRRHHCWLRRF
jgi:L-asparaginase